MSASVNPSFVAALRHAISSEAWMAIGLALLAIAYAGIGIQTPSLWVDEAATLSATQRSWPQLWQLLHNIDAVHGVYYAMVKLWLSIVGASPFTLRLPSLLAFGALVATTYLIARHWLPRRTAVAAAIACAVLPRSTWMAIEGRSWALGALLAALTTMALLRWVEGRRITLLVGYTALAAAAIATDIYLAFLVAAHGVSLLLVRLPRRRWWHWLVSAGIAATLAAPIVLLAASERAQLGDREPLMLGDWVMSVLAKQFTIGDTPGLAPTLMPRWLWSGSATMLAVITWLLLAWGIYRSLQKGTGPATVTWWMTPWIALPPVAVGSLALFGLNLYHPRYFAFTVPAFAICIAQGWAALGRIQLRRTVAILCLVAAVPVFWSQRGPYAKNGYDWAQTAAEVRAVTASGDGVYFAPAPPARMIESAYPGAFEGLTDIALVQTAAEEGSLDGSSAPLDGMLLQRAPDRVVALWSIRATSQMAELQEFARAGYRPIQDWAGPETIMVVLQR